VFSNNKDLSQATVTTDQGKYVVDVNRMRIMPEDSGTLLLDMGELKGTINHISISNVKDLEDIVTIEMDVKTEKRVEKDNPETTQETIVDNKTN